MTEPTGLKKALEAAVAKEMEYGALGNANPAPAEASDAQKLLSTCRRLLRKQQDKYITDRSAYETERTDKSNWYRAEIARLADEAEGEMTALDKRWATLEDETRTIIRQIKALLSA